MAVIDVHTHFIPRFVMDEAASPGGVFGVCEDDGWLVHPEGFRYPVSPIFWTPRLKIAEMDELGIDFSVLSLTPTLFFHGQAREEGIEYSRRSNDALLELIAGHGRLKGFATLPLQAPEAAAAELERAVSELGFVGAQIGTNYEDGRPLDGHELEPLYAAANHLGVPLMLHPYYLGPKPRLEDYYLTNSIGQPLDTCIAAARLMYSGVFDRFPNLKIVLVHGGGYMPYQLGRLDRAFEVRQEPKVRTDRTPSSYLDCFWMDTVTHSDAALRFLVSLVGTERIVLGTDLPFDMGDPRSLDRITRVGINPHALGETTAKLLPLAF